MPIFSGRHGNVRKTLYVRDPMNPENPPTVVNTAVSAILNWILSETTSPHTYSHSGTAAGTDRQGGTYDFNGTFETLGVVPEIMPGEYFNFEGYTAPNDPFVNGVGKVVRSLLLANPDTHPLYNWPGSIIEQVEITWDFTNGEIPNIVTTFAQANGLEIDVVEQFQQDDTTFQAPSICPMSLDYKSRNDADSAYERREWPLVRSVTLTITSQNQSFINSSTSCGTGRTPGAVDVTMAIAVDSSETPPIIFPGQAERNIKVRDRITLYMWTEAKPVSVIPITDGGPFWIFEGMRVTEFNEFRVDPNTQEIIGFTVNLGMSATDAEAVADNLGFIARPGEMKNNQPAFELPWWPDQYNQNTYTPA